MGEAAFVDRVARDLAAGRFLLLIVGDGITQGTQQIIEYLDEQPGLAFTFGLVEMAEYRFHDTLVGCERTIIHPRLLAKTVNLERIVIRNEAPNVLVTYEPPAAAPSTSTSGGQANSEIVQQWRLFAESLTTITFDDPSQPPARNGGMGWMRVPLPGPAHLTPWRSDPQQRIGAFVRFQGADGLAAYDLLLVERETIDTEFRYGALSAPDWTVSAHGSSIELTVPSALPWNTEREDEQFAWFTLAANQFVNSLRSRLSAMHLG